MTDGQHIFCEAVEKEKRDGIGRGVGGEGRETVIKTLKAYL